MPLLRRSDPPPEAARQPTPRLPGCVAGAAPAFPRDLPRDARAVLQEGVAEHGAS